MASVQCPTCKSSVIWGEASPQRPFCSERCKQIDLGAWASDGYVLQGKPPASSEELEALERAIEEGLKNGQFDDQSGW